MKGNPNDEVRFLMENPTRSDFFVDFFVDFIDMVKVGFLYIGASSCGLEGKRKTPAEKEA
ncbi:hypothetical protein CN435_14635 [Priestia megaterium]|nr:hypothetical protein CN435_14635 [Priestia megaterium]QCR27067.1 hypothetical protein C1N54_09525 [Priestia megaterium]